MRYIMSFPWECQLQTLCPGVGIEPPTSHAQEYAA